MILEHLNEFLLPIIISLAETTGILIIAYSLVKCFIEYVMHIFKKCTKTEDHLQENLAEGLATALEFMMGAEILKTVSVPNVNELMSLGLIILMRVVLSLLIHFELGQEEKRHELAEKKANSKATV